ncbi:DUF3389 domain-containing protein [Vibrio sp. S9_S30]|uniref:DUF3389 domain-containing protein n=1 Tax=Vibrio sp. S9_S30 TaxID=2720226 RepID=UPI0016801393|nr:DUF3389 domain-containing protein [Vibrio sp. S9_S30]MBD1559000.1 DUF3389 domain-containing protein [Vibrio sp. S9_S30]
MVISFKSGKVIATLHEVVVKIDGDHRATLHSQVDAITLIGKGVNVITSNGSETKWSVKLDNEKQLTELAEHLGVHIQ